MTIDLLELGASALGDLVEQVAFVGGATIVLWLTDPGAPAPRPTKDVDVVIEVTTPSAFHAFQDSLRKRGFHEDVYSNVICRWRHEASELVLDAMPANGALLGFDNPWQAAAMPHAAAIDLPSGIAIRAITPPYLVATKLAAFASRGGGDHLGSPDLEDIIRLVDGLEELVHEMASAQDDVRRYVQGELVALLRQERFLDALFGFRPDAASQERVDVVLLPRLRQIATG